MNVEILIVDDHPMMLKGLRQQLEQKPDWKIVGEATSGSDALDQARKLKPNLIIMDVHLPDMRGIEVARQLREDMLGAYVIAFSGDSNRALVDEALISGASGYLLKATPPEELFRAVEVVMEGRLYLCPELASTVLSSYKKGLLAAEQKPLLTQREIQVLRLLAEGFQNKQIAGRLQVSIKAVEKTRARLMEKLQCSGIAQLTRYAVRQGIVSN